MKSLLRTCLFYLRAEYLAFSFALVATFSASTQQQFSRADHKSGSSCEEAQLEAAETRIIHVDPTATGTADGSSWANAYASLYTALQDTETGDEIWLREGMYPISESQGTWFVPSGVIVRGGFLGSEAVFEERPAFSLEHATHLTGDVLLNNPEDAATDDPARSDDRGDLVFVSGDCADFPSQLENLILENAQGVAFIVAWYADIQNVWVRWNFNPSGPACRIEEGNPAFNTVTFEKNSSFGDGGAIGLDIHTGGASLHQVQFFNNSALRGAALHVAESSSEIEPFYNMEASACLTLSECTFNANIALDSGGAIYFESYNAARHLSIDRTVFYMNQATNSGGAIALDSAKAGAPVGEWKTSNVDHGATNLIFARNNANKWPVSPPTAFDYFDNCTIVDNLANTNGAPILPEYNYSACIIWGNTHLSGQVAPLFGHSIRPAFLSSLVQGSGGSGPQWNNTYGDDRSGNLDVDPQFVRDANGTAAGFGYRLQSTSPAKDTVPAYNGAPSSDLLGNIRPYGPAIDMGCFEWVPTLAEIVADFAGIDTDGSHTLSAAEIQSALGVGLPYATALISESDSNGDSLLSVSEGIEAMGASEPVLHRADTNGDHSFELQEVLRVIQLYNANRFFCADSSGSTEDGFSLVESGRPECVPHAADYIAQDWKISLSELLRLVQLYNAGAYVPCTAGEDGFCATSR